MLDVLAAFDRRSAREMADCMTEDVVVRPPGFLLGHDELNGRDAVGSAFARIVADVGTDRTLEYRNRRFFLDGGRGDRVLLVVDIRISGPARDPFGAVAAQLFETTDGKVSRIDSWGSEDEGLSQFEDPVEVLVPSD